MSDMARSQFPRRPGRPKTETPNPIDVRVGARLRLRRNMLGLSQEKLGEAIGLTFQQVQKYERGANRIGASRLHELSRVLMPRLDAWGRRLGLGGVGLGDGADRRLGLALDVRARLAWLASCTGAA